MFPLPRSFYTVLVSTLHHFLTRGKWARIDVGYTHVIGQSGMQSASPVLHRLPLEPHTATNRQSGGNNAATPTSLLPHHLTIQGC